MYHYYNYKNNNKNNQIINSNTMFSTLRNKQQKAIIRRAFDFHDLIARELVNK